MQTNSDNDMIQQDNEKGPGWFLKLAYLGVSIFMVYYFFTYKDWKSDYQENLDEINKKISQQSSK
jgi:hypothetical protein